jgi:hypothetical protein
MDYCLTGKQKTLLKFSFQQVKEVVPKKQQNFELAMLFGIEKMVSQNCQNNLALPRGD